MRSAYLDLLLVFILIVVFLGLRISLGKTSLTILLLGKLLNSDSSFLSDEIINREVLSLIDI